LNYEVSSNGTYFLSLQIVDLVGNSTTTKQLYLYVDLDPPKIESISIENWTIYGTGIIPAYAEVSDDIGLKNVSLILDGELVKVEEPEKKYASVSKNLTKLSSSRHKLTVVAFDVLDRTSSDYVIFFVDKEKPSIEDYTEGIFSSDPLINFNVSDDLAIKNLSLTISNDTYRFEDNKTFGFREEKRYEY
ncbi:MAG: hypothetical protein GWO20_08925, partial [Candidatus Korarchaeota archaeon]|nr:hypothetical protein [Candidatus Korarchaeota archaeon]NIU83543.1 hypothetical protein [Candidatus Thorarchaeota archaeon]NIW13805.1 hypothetical protein [Candidatus Thorarchaeota archaeon]